jgi:hypothetical protein
VSIRTKRGKYREEPCDMEEEVGDVSVSQSVSLRSSESVGYFFFLPPHARDLTSLRSLHMYVL